VVGICGQTVEPEPDTTRSSQDGAPNKSMAVRIAHAGVIHFFVIHAEEYEGYAFW
jgi:hypothetical protein